MDEKDTYITVTRGGKKYDLGIRLTPGVLENATPKQLNDWGNAVGVAYTNLLKKFKKGEL